MIMDSDANKSLNKMGTNWYLSTKGYKIHIGKSIGEVDPPRFIAKMSETVLTKLWETGKYLIVDEYEEKYSLQDFWITVKNYLPFKFPRHSADCTFEDDNYW